MAEPHRNPFVLRRESGHPGLRLTTLVGTAADLSRLGRELADAAKSGSVDVHRDATEEHGQSSRIGVRFLSATDAELDALHEQPPFGALRRISGCLVAVAVLALAVQGLRSLLG